MKKRAPAKKQAARKPAKKTTASKTAKKSSAGKSSAGKSASRASEPSRESAQGARYTPAPLRTDGSPAFRYPPQ
jgi:hypothetical protein